MNKFFVLLGFLVLSTLYVFLQSPAPAAATRDLPRPAVVANVTSAISAPAAATVAHPGKEALLAQIRALEESIAKMENAL